MAIKPKCDGCLEELDRYGALLFGPPTERPDGTCEKEVPKLRICQKDYWHILTALHVDVNHPEWFAAEVERLRKSNLIHDERVAREAEDAGTA